MFSGVKFGADTRCSRSSSKSPLWLDNKGKQAHFLRSLSAHICINTSNPVTNFKRHLFLGWRFLLLFFNFYAPRRIFYCLSASRTNNEHHRPEVALDKSSKHEPGKALIAYKRGERRSLLLNPKSSELGLGLIYQGLSQ